VVNAEIIALYFYNHAELRTISCRQHAEYRSDKTDGAEIYADVIVRGHDKKPKKQ
jgi:hypothetical protein